MYSIIIYYEIIYHFFLTCSDQWQKEFEIPPNDIPFARVNHNKYMVTDNGAFISTSNWSADYFTSTGGVSIIVNQTESSTSKYTDQTVQNQLVAVFTRDWESKYASSL